jgi:hypothetical protein
VQLSLGINTSRVVLSFFFLLHLSAGVIGNQASSDVICILPFRELYNHLYCPSFDTTSHRHFTNTLLFIDKLIISSTHRHIICQTSCHIYQTESAHVLGKPHFPRSIQSPSSVARCLVQEVDFNRWSLTDAPSLEAISSQPALPKTKPKSPSQFSTYFPPGQGRQSKRIDAKKRTNISKV